MWFLGVIAGLIVGSMLESFGAAILLAGIGGVVVHLATRRNADSDSVRPPPDLKTQVVDLRIKVTALERRLLQVEEQLANTVLAPTSVTTRVAEPAPEHIERAAGTAVETESTTHADATELSPESFEPLELSAATPTPQSAAPWWGLTTPLPIPGVVVACDIAPSDTVAYALPEITEDEEFLAEAPETPEIVAEPIVVSAAPVPDSVPTPVFNAPTYAAQEKPSTVAPRRPPAPIKPSIPFKNRLPDPVRKFIYGGNTLVKLGVLILFLGLAFLLRYTAERVTVPIELRYAGVALVGAGLLGLGWFLRRRRADYALIMQGMGIGVFYLTTLAAMKFHDHLLPSDVGFGFMAVVSLLGAALAILQNAPVLAIIAALEGFATPVLISTGGNHMMALMIYLAILDVSIVLIAWFNAWRILNVIGFVGTFTLASGWANEHYTNEQYAPVQAFLILFFLLFTAVGVLFARRTLLDSKLDSKLATSDTDSLAQKAGATLAQVGRVDSALVFGTPLTAFGLQYLLTKPWEFGPAFSALALSAFYLLLARVIFSRERVGLALLAEAYAIMGVIFGTLAIPLGFEGVWTSAAWAVEGAGMYWLGIRQNRTYSRAFAYLVLLGATYKLLLSISVIAIPDAPLLHGSTIGPILLALSAFSIWLQNRKAKLDTDPSWEAIPGGLMLWLGMLSLTLLPWQWFVPQTAAAATAVLALIAYVVARRFDLKLLSAVVAFLQVFAVVSFVPTLHFTSDAAVTAVFDGGWHGMLAAFTIAVCLLLTAGWNLANTRKKAQDDDLPPESANANVLAVAVGASLLSLALLFEVSLQTAAAATAVLSVITYLVQRRFDVKSLSGVVAYLQGLAVVSFLITLHRAAGTDANAVLESGWQGTLAALVIAASILFTAGWSMASARKAALAEGLPPAWTKANALAVLVGAGLLHLAMLFGISLEQAALIWPITSCVVLWIALRMAHTPLAGFTLGLQIVSALLFISRMNLPDLTYSVDPAEPLPTLLLAPFGHLRFWTPLFIGVVAWLCGDWIRDEAKYLFASLTSAPTDNVENPSPITRWGNPWCARTVALWTPAVWGLLWWMSAWLNETSRVLEIRSIPEYFTTATIATILITSVLITVLARWRAWTEMGTISGLTLPALVLCIYVSIAGSGDVYLPSAYLGYVVWPLALIWHLRLLHVQSRWLAVAQRQVLHVAGFWFFLLLASRECQAQFAELADVLSSWSMLGWVLVPALSFWLLRSSALGRRWPLSEFRQAYLEIACLPVAAYLLLWCFISNILSPGNASPLPYLPILNPLELGQWLVLAALLLWWRALPEASSIRLSENAAKTVAAVMGWFLLTAMVLRSCHHWAGVLWDAEALFDSRLTQAALSITWAIMGMSAMLLGNRRASRMVWIGGAGLLAVVVIKLFVVELADRGGLYRIVSFIGVGVLLLIVGYFAPVPVKAAALIDATDDQTDEPAKEAL